MRDRRCFELPAVRPPREYQRRDERDDSERPQRIGDPPGVELVASKRRQRDGQDATARARIIRGSVGRRSTSGRPRTSNISARTTAITLATAATSRICASLVPTQHLEPTPGPDGAGRAEALALTRAYGLPARNGLQASLAAGTVTPCMP
jgi:hypothetical protein